MRTIERKDLEGRWPNNCDPKVFEMNDEVASYYTGQYALYEHFLYLYLLKRQVWVNLMKKYQEVNLV